MPGEHKVHPYLHLETLCRGESCIRLYPGFYCFLLFSDSLPGQKPPGLNPEIFAPGIVSTKHKEHSTLAFSPDGKYLFFTRYDENWNEDIYWVDAKIIEDLKPKELK